MSGFAVPVPATRAHAAAAVYVGDCAAIRSSAASTDERSYYPALNRLLNALGQLVTPRITPISDPSARGGDFPDVVCWDALSQVCALPIEAKPSFFTRDQLLDLDQARRYARSFGGGMVLTTNLWQFIWCELTKTGELIERDRADLLSSQAAFERGDIPHPADAAHLLNMVRTAWTLRPTLSNAHEVAALLGYHAKLMSIALEHAPDPARLLQPLSVSLRDGLGMELEDRFLNGTVIQTLVYGIFAAWLESDDPASFKWQEAPHALGLGIIASLLHETSNPTVVRTTGIEKHLAAVARVLNWVDRPAFEAQFGAAGGEAVEYFYEPFLAAFDPALRAKLGVWYTPRDIADYQVRRVDFHLRTDFGLAAGLADDQAIVLDPACGTGTYLAAVIRHIYDYHIDRGEPSETAARRTVEAANTRLIGFEVLPAAYVVCQLHLHRLLTQELGVTSSDDHLRIYLCNALTGWGSGHAPPALPLPGLEQELQASLDIKGAEPVLVVIGNPPYEGYSAVDNPEEEALVRPWVEPLWRDWRIRKNRLGDLYVRFWRVGLRKISELSNRGVVCFITNRKWLGGRSFPAMRGDFATRFDRIIVDDLGGDVRAGQPGEGSAFTTATASGVRVGVAITTAIKTGVGDGSTAEVFTRTIRGSGVDKRASLRSFAGTELGDGLQPRSVSAAGRWRFLGEDADDSPGLDEYFEQYWSGVQPVRDEAVTDGHKLALIARMSAYFDWARSWESLIAEYPAFAIERKRYAGRAVRGRHKDADSSFQADRVVQLLHRPGEVRWLYWEPRFKLLNEPRRTLIPQSSLPGQQYIAVPATPRRPNASRPIVSHPIVAFEACDPNARLFPRVITAHRTDGQLDLDLHPPQGTRPNVLSAWTDAVRALGIDGSDHQLSDLVFDALIGVMFAPQWSARIPPDLDDFAPVPLPATADGLRSAAGLGRQIGQLIDPSTIVDGVTTGTLRDHLRSVATAHDTGGRRVTEGSRARGAGGRWVPDDGGTVRWNDASGWTGVPRCAWQFTVGGFSLLPKWLSYRVGDDLSSSDLDHFTSLARRVVAILGLQPDCDEVYRAAMTRRLEPPAAAAGGAAAVDVA